MTTTINIGEDEYIEKIGGGSGVTVVIHPQSHMPHPEEDGFLAKPGQINSAAVRKVIKKSIFFLEF